jgi:cytoplasmic iron level regulating protein YaaA (DUF328/UPF0246 family)
VISRIKVKNGNKLGCNVLCKRTTTAKIVNAMKGKTKGKLRSLLNLLGNLGKVACWHWEDFALDNDFDGGGSATDAGSDYHPAMFAFLGPTYQGLNPAACNGKALNYLASCLLIIDPVYGVFYSLQGMHPYRLEMGCRPFLPWEGANLATRWKRHVSAYLGRELAKISHASSPKCNDENKGESLSILRRRNIPP